MTKIDPYKDDEQKLPNRFNLWIERLRQQLRPIPDFLEGDGTPEGSVTAKRGTRYYNRTGGAGTYLYVKTSTTGNTGWVAYG